MNKIVKCAVFGSNGYLGNHLSLYLKNKGYYVNSYDIHSSSSLENYYSLDITNKKALKEIDWDIDYLFFFSGLTGTKIGFEKYTSFIQVNELGLLNVLDEAKNREKKPHIIFPSTRLVYKGAKFPLKEEAEKEPLTIYAVNKLACEDYLKIYYNQFDIPYTIFRICVPYGNFISEDYSYGTIGFFLNKAQNGENITLFGDGSLKRTFTHVKDICYQIINCVSHSNSIGQIFNISGETLTLDRVAKIFALKYSVDVNYIKWPAEDLKIETGDTIFDDSKILSVIGNFIQTSLEDFIKRI